MPFRNNNIPHTAVHWLDSIQLQPNCVSYIFISSFIVDVDYFLFYLFPAFTEFSPSLH